MHSCRLPAPRLEPGRRGPERFWALRRYEQIIDRVDERCQIDGRARGDDLAVGDRGFIDESGEGWCWIAEIRSGQCLRPRRFRFR